MARRKRLTDPMLQEWAKKHAQLERSIIQYVDATSDKGAARLARVVGALTTTNCWFAEWDVKPMVEDALRFRARRICSVSTRSKNGS
jgi:hypothetical protein